MKEKNIKNGGEVVNIYSRDSLYVDFNIPENILPFIKKGQTVYIKSQKNTINDLQYVIDPDTYMAPARSYFICSDCIIGSLIDVDLVVQTHYQTTIIPYEAIFIKDNKNYVFIVEDNKVKEKLVQTGLRDHHNIEILSGIKQKDQVIIKGQSRLSNDDEVKIHTEEASF